MWGLNATALSKKNDPETRLRHAYSATAAASAITACTAVQRAKQHWENGKFQSTPTSRQPLNRFGWNLKLIELHPPPEDYPHAKFDFDPSTWVVWTNTQLGTAMFLSCLFSYWSLCDVHSRAGNVSMGHLSNGSRKSDGSHGSWITRYWPMTHQFLTLWLGLLLWQW